MHPAESKLFNSYFAVPGSTAYCPTIYFLSAFITPFPYLTPIHSFSSLLFQKDKEYSFLNS
jgi:hypothetical protein